MKTRNMYSLIIGFLGIIALLTACAPAAPPTVVPPGEAGGEVPDVIPEEAAVQPEGQQVDLPAFDPDLAEAGTWMYWFDNNILLFVPGGEFRMGAAEFEDNPPRTVSLSPYWIYRYPVTNDMYRLCVAAGACEEPATEPPYESVFNPDEADYPVVGVSWESAQEYCHWMDAELTTEAQWEKAARGLEGFPYPWGTDQPDCSLANFQGCLGDTTHVLAYYPESMSPFELMDTAGNTYEWTRDVYQEDYHTLAPPSDPLGPESGTYRSVRGSGFDTPMEQLHLAKRTFLQPDKYRADLGFRCVVTEPTNFAPYCEQIAYIPGENKGPGQPPPGDPDEYMHHIPDCEVDDPTFTSNPYCINHQNLIGGATVTYTGDLQSVTGVSCDNNNPMGCWGPENTPFQVTLCNPCSQWVPPDYKMPSCDPGYYLDGNLCKFDGYPPQPATICPMGWVLDVDGYCKDTTLPVDPDCPQGFTYDPQAECCTATYIEPSGGWAGTPPAEYSSCPVGYDYLDPPGVCKWGGMWISDLSCETFSAQLGDCRDKPPGDGCTNPSQYGDANSCTNAGCKWVPPVTGAGGGYCTFP